MKIVEELKILVAKEKQIELEILEKLCDVKEQKIYASLGYSSLGAFCEDELGMSEDVACKRSQAANAISKCPELLGLLEAGETYVSHLAMISPRMTKLNQQIILENLPGKSKRGLEMFLSRLTDEGELKDAVPTVTLHLKVDLETAKLFERALKVAQTGKPSQEAMSSAVREIADEYLNRHDPARKAERCIKTTAPAAPEQPVRRIPSQTRYRVFMRDQHQCTYISQSGKRCEEKNYLQIDHVIPFARKGTHDLSNLRALCKTHNILCAEETYGRNFMRSKQQS